jgi:hypothetical protein
LNNATKRRERERVRERERERERERDASACMRRHQASALAPVQQNGPGEGREVGAGCADAPVDFHREGDVDRLPGAQVKHVLRLASQLENVSKT